jgi:hypothetical protein
MRIRRVLVIAAAMAILPAGIAAADGGHDHGGGGGEYRPPSESEPCPVPGMEETTDPETGRRECIVFRSGEAWGSWDPATSDDDPNYSPGDRGQRWGWNTPDEKPKPGEKDVTGAELHGSGHDPKCSQDAQNKLLSDARASLARYDGAEGFAKATREGYYLYPIGGKVWHAFNTKLYDDADPATGKQRDIDPWFPENIIYAMTDDGWKAMGIMFTMVTDESTGKLWKEQPVATWPNYYTTTEDPVTGVPRQETCYMHWHTHAGAGGTATGGGVDPRSAESHPMTHIWAWGIDMWERGADGTEANSWFAPYRLIPAVCSEKDACI